MLLVRKPGLKFMARIGVSAWDWSTASFTRDGAWHAHDVSSIVPAKAKMVRICVNMRGSTSAESISFRPTGDTGTIGMGYIQAQGISITGWRNFEIPITGVGTFDYKANSAGVTDFNMSVAGWWF